MKNKKKMTIAIVAAIFVLSGISYFAIKAITSGNTPQESVLSGVVKEFPYKDSKVRLAVQKVTMDATNLDKNFPATSGKQYVKLTLSIAYAPKAAFNELDFKLGNVNDASTTASATPLLKVGREFDMTTSAGSGEVGFLVDKAWKKEDLQFVLFPIQDNKEIARLSFKDQTTPFAANSVTSLTGKTGVLKDYSGSLNAEVTKITRNFQNSKATISDGSELVAIDITLTNASSKAYVMNYPTISLITNLINLNTLSKEYTDGGSYENGLPSQATINAGDKLTKTIYFMVPAGDKGLKLILGSSSNAQTINLE